MKTDLDRLMQINHVDALLVMGAAQHNPSMVYLTGLRHLTTADLVKRCGEPALLFHGPMEREEAAKTGLRTRSYNDYPLGPLLKQAGGNRFQAAVLRYQHMLTDAGLTSGKVLVYGQAQIGTVFSTLNALHQVMPELEFSGDLTDAVLPQAMVTKDPGEVEHIRQMGKVTTAVVAQVADFLTSHKAKDGILVQSDGQPVRIKDVKDRINLWLAERGTENPEGTIFAIGHDAGVPHSSGNPEDVLRLGQTIVFDIYPCEAGGGYFYDFTRTWCLGYAPDEAYQLYDQVLSVYRQVSAEIKEDASCTALQRRTCELFEAYGHPTLLSHPQTEQGYVHSLGHGVGLNIHEKPFSGATADETDIFTPGITFTIEPGLYYPERGLGVRLEDTVWIRSDGQPEVLAPYPMDLVLPVTG